MNARPMNKGEFDSLKRGDVLYDSESGEEWTVVAYLSPARGWLALRAKIEINHRSSKFWDCATLLSEEDLIESIEAIGLKAISIIYPNGLVKKADTE